MYPTELPRNPVFPHARLLDNAHYFLKKARLKDEDQYPNIMASIIFCAFALESFLNCMGKLKLKKRWDELEQSNINPKGKLVILTLDFSDKIDFGKRPFQNFGEIFKYRNLLAHAKVESLKNANTPDESEWEKLSTIENAEKYYNDTNDMIDKLIEYAELPKLIKGTIQMFFGAGSHNNHATNS